MTDAPFGARTGLIGRLARSQVRTGDLRAAVERFSRTAPGPGAAATELRLAVVDGPDRSPVLLVEDCGRCTRVPLIELAGEMSRAHVPATPDAVTAALHAWLVRRPVPDAVAAASGLAVLDWADPRQSELGWRLVVVRDSVAVPWRPSRTASLPLVHQARSAAQGRSAALRAHLRIEGPVGLWSHADVPGIDTALLVRAEDLVEEMAAAGLQLRDGHVVVTPGHPVAMAEHGVAHRLAAASGEPSRTIAWREILDLGWA